MSQNRSGRGSNTLLYMINGESLVDGPLSVVDEYELLDERTCDPIKALVKRATLVGHALSRENADYFELMQISQEKRKYLDESFDAFNAIMKKLKKVRKII